MVYKWSLSAWYRPETQEKLWTNQRLPKQKIPPPIAQPVRHHLYVFQNELLLVARDNRSNIFKPRANPNPVMIGAKIQSITLTIKPLNPALNVSIA